MVWALSRLSVNLENRARFDVNGSYNPDRLVDIMDTSSENPDENTSYSLVKLYEIYISGAADQLLIWQILPGTECPGEYGKCGGRGKHLFYK